MHEMSILFFLIQMKIKLGPPENFFFKCPKKTNAIFVPYRMKILLSMQQCIFLHFKINQIQSSSLLWMSKS